MTSVSSQRGFTLLELMVTIGMAGILFGVGVPSFVRLVESNRATAHTNELVNAVNIARSEAIQRGETITVCSSTDAATCSTDVDWSTGWVVLAADGTPLRAWSAVGVAGTLVGSADNIQFQGRGWVSSAATTFALRMPRCDGTEGRDLSINLAGRVSVARVAC
jgi:type IV fimbrial biogenesis protein FimT